MYFIFNIFAFLKSTIIICTYIITDVFVVLCDADSGQF